MKKLLYHLLDTRWSGSKSLRGAPRDDTPATSDYVYQLAEAVRAAGLPERHREFVESFRPEKSGENCGEN